MARRLNSATSSPTRAATSRTGGVALGVPARWLKQLGGIYEVAVMSQKPYWPEKCHPAIVAAACSSILRKQ